MVNAGTKYGEVVLLAPTQSLTLQVADWVRKRPNLSLRLISDSQELDYDTDLAAAEVVIVDATASPSEAISVLEQAGRRIGRQRLAVYTETKHPGLARWVQMHGAAMIIGPMSHGDWNTFFRPEQARRISKPVPRAPKFGPSVMPLPTTYISDRLAAVARRYEDAMEEAYEPALVW